MKLTKNKLIDVACGYVYTEETPEGIRFHRFSKSQEETFKAGNKYFDVEREPFFYRYFENNCNSTAGVKFDFYTDAKEMTVNIGMAKPTNDGGTMQIDTYVDGK